MNVKEFMTITAVQFKRTQESKTEFGVVINEDQLIVDAEGKVVETPIWSYTWEWPKGHVVFAL